MTFYVLVRKDQAYVVHLLVWIINCIDSTGSWEINSLLACIDSTGSWEINSLLATQGTPHVSKHHK